MKYIVATSFVKGNYWADQMGLKRGEYIVLIPQGDFHRGFSSFNASEVVFVEEEPFDYPVEDSQREAYERLVNDIQSKIVIDF